uniref:Uncharacterized protein n=1 Tax=Schistosoma curassoni TaxID=6186 RepID=A0A183L3V0_9TREM
MIYSVFHLNYLNLLDLLYFDHDLDHQQYPSG